MGFTISATTDFANFPLSLSMRLDTELAGTCAALNRSTKETALACLGCPIVGVGRDSPWSERMDARFPVFVGTEDVEGVGPNCNSIMLAGVIAASVVRVVTFFAAVAANTASRLR